MKSKRITVKPETRLERHVKAWINSRAANYPDNGAEGVLKDLFYGGCSGGMVNHLIYTTDCVTFFAKHRRDISALLAEMIEGTGEGLEQLFSNPNSMQWEKNDPLAQEDCNRNILAWFGFEETARRLADRQEIEV